MLNRRGNASSNLMNTKFKLMKTILTLLAMAATIGFITPTESDARPKTGARRVVAYHSCGAPIVEVFTIYDRSRSGKILDAGWRRQPHYCNYDRRGRGRDHDHHDHHHDGPRRRGGVSFSFGR